MIDHIDTDTEREKLAGLIGYTPGPWEFITGEYGYSCLVSDRNEEVLTVGGYNDGDYPIVWMGEDASPQDTLLIAAAPDLLATVHRLLDALDAERVLTAEAHKGWQGEVAVLRSVADDNLTRAEKAEAGRDEWKDEYQTVERLLSRYKDAATNRQAGRDQALARLAAAQRDTREHAMLHVLTAPLFPPTLEADRATLAKRIGALPLDPDAEAALQRVVDTAWNEAVEAAAKIVNGTAKYHMSDPDDIEAVHLTATEIRALERPEASHE